MASAVNARRIHRRFARLVTLQPWWLAGILLVVGLTGCGSLVPISAYGLQQPSSTSPASVDGIADHGGFSFAVAVDQREFAGQGRYDSPRYFRGAAEAIKNVGGAALVISPGDIDPPSGIKWTLDQVLSSGVQWYPAVGNHEAETPEDMEWLRGYDWDANGPGLPPNVVRIGPAGCPDTTYSFDYANVHFAVLNEYCDTGGDTATDGDIPDHLYDWLATDLAETSQQHLFVIGHEPAFPQPDEDNGRLRHVGDSLDVHPEHRDRFWNLLRERGVRAYIAGHTHNYSAVQIDGVWQIDGGHARGDGDLGAPSTIVMVRVDGGSVSFDSYREVFDGNYDYRDIIHHGVIAGP